MGHEQFWTLLWVFEGYQSERSLKYNIKIISKIVDCVLTRIKEESCEVDIGRSVVNELLVTFVDDEGDLLLEILTDSRLSLALVKDGPKRSSDGKPKYINVARRCVTRLEALDCMSDRSCNEVVT